MAKGKKTGGRKIGSQNKKTIAAKAIMASALASAEAVGKQLMPLEVLLMIMNRPKTSERTRIECAKAAAPFCHPKLVTAEQVTTTKTHEQRLAELQELMDLPPTLRSGWPDANAGLMRYPRSARRGG